MMRRGPGIGGLRKQTMAKERFTQLGNKIEQEDNASVRIFIGFLLYSLLITRYI